MGPGRERTGRGWERDASGREEGARPRGGTRRGARPRGRFCARNRSRALCLTSLARRRARIPAEHVRAATIARAERSTNAPHGLPPPPHSTPPGNCPPRPPLAPTAPSGRAPRRELSGARARACARAEPPARASPLEMLARRAVPRRAIVPAIQTQRRPARAPLLPRLPPRLPARADRSDPAGREPSAPSRDRPRAALSTVSARRDGGQRRRRAPRADARRGPPRRPAPGRHKGTTWTARQEDDRGARPRPFRDLPPSDVRLPRPHVPSHFRDPDALSPHAGRRITRAASARARTHAGHPARAGGRHPAATPTPSFPPAPRSRLRPFPRRSHPKPRGTRSRANAPRGGGRGGWSWSRRQCWAARAKGRDVGVSRAVGRVARVASGTPARCAQPRLVLPASVCESRRARTSRAS